jgi:hypothetical protein
MIRKLNKISSLLLLAIFLLPTVVKLEHHHDHFHCNVKNEKHYHDYHDKCLICSFEFSIFISDINKIVSEEEIPVSNYKENYQSAYYSNLSKYSFSLRAPPYVQI